MDGHHKKIIKKRKIDRQTVGKKDRQMKTGIDRQTDRQTTRQTNRQMDEQEETKQKTKYK